MRKFDTNIQAVRYEVLKEVAKHAWDGTLQENILNIPNIVIPGKHPTMRCCVYKERAIVGERIKLAMGGNKDKKNVIEVIDIACEECPMGGYEVTNTCQGCLTHRCTEACQFGAITFDDRHKAHIDKTKCKECGMCSRVCPYHAIRNFSRPCEEACKIKAITMGEDKEARINDDVCISCGACVIACPFGAISDKSFILDAVKILKNSNNGKNYNVVAVVAPSIASQFKFVKLGQVITSLRQLGFSNVIEAALGADMVAKHESKELVDKEFLISSCCPAFVDYVNKSFPSFKESLSTSLSPMATIAKYIKEKDRNCRVIFIGPCTAKKMEYQKSEVKQYVDCVLTFEELMALVASRDIDPSSLSETGLDNASYFGRIFAKCGGLSEAIQEGIKEQNLHFKLNSCSCDGIEQCKIALSKKKAGISDANFIEGMACVGGCIGGAGCLTHGIRDKSDVEKFSNEASDKTISDSLSHNK